MAVCDLYRQVWQSEVHPATPPISGRSSTPYIESSVDGRVAEETLEQLNYICMHINGMFYELTVHCSIVHNLYNKFNVQ